MPTRFNNFFEVEKRYQNFLLQFFILFLIVFFVIYLES